MYEKINQNTEGLIVFVQFQFITTPDSWMLLQDQKIRYEFRNRLAEEE